MSDRLKSRKTYLITRKEQHEVTYAVNAVDEHDAMDRMLAGKGRETHHAIIYGEIFPAQRLDLKNPPPVSPKSRGPKT